ncbi:MAG: hypothetical protein KDC92_00975, partial [Bacteroidetes bacterium]|nr:hypothetical protein [Bacteroidota bacterium]
MNSLYKKLQWVIPILVITCGTASAQLKGNYTIDTASTAANNYTSFSAAIADLYTQGVSGVVRFAVSSGTYAEQLSFDKAIPGASKSNTITFQGRTGNANDVLLTTQSDTMIVVLKKSSHITLKDLSLVATNNIQTRLIYMNDSSTNNHFDNLVMNMKDGGSRSMAVECQESHYNSWTNCVVRDAIQAFWINGVSGSKRAVGNTISKCSASGFHDIGIKISFDESTVVSRNKLTSNFTNWIGQGALTAFSSAKPMINGNEVESRSYPLLMNNCTGGGTTDSVHVRNNVLKCKEDYQDVVYIYDCENFNFTHNYLFGLRGGLMNIYVSSIKSYTIANNIFESDGSYSVMRIGVSDTTARPFLMDHNAFWVTNYSLLVDMVRAGRYSNLFDFQQRAFGGKHNRNSLEADPVWNHTTNRTRSPFISNKGIDLGVSTDIDGNKRPNGLDKKVDIGPCDYFLAPIDLDVEDLIAPLSVSLTTNKVITSFKNGGLDTIFNQDAYVHYSVDSGATWIKDTLHIDTLAPTKIIQFSFTRPWVPTRGGDFRLSVKIDPPIKGDPDKVDQKDWELCSGMAGTYTVGTKGQFKDLYEVKEALKCGVAGNVTFLLQPGSYYLSISFDEINGANSSSRVTFRSSHVDSVMLYANEANPVLTLNGTDYVNFENITFQQQHATSGVVHLLNSANYNNFSNCVIDHVSTSPRYDSYCFGIADNPSQVWSPKESGNYNKVSQCVIRGGGVALAMSGESGKTYGNEIIGNLIAGDGDYIAAIHYQDTIVFEKNELLPQTGAAQTACDFYEIGQFRIQQNRVEGTFRVNQARGFGSLVSMFNNNVVVQSNQFSWEGALSAIGWQNTQVLHNSLFNRSGSNWTSAAGIFNCYGLDFRNNHIVSENTNVFAINNTVFYKFDFNNLYSSNGDVAEVDRSTTFSTLNDFKSWNSGMFNANSTDMNPMWGSLTMLTPSANSPQLYAPNAGLHDDFLEKARCKYVSALGAYEIPFKNGAPRASFSVPDTAWVNTPVTISNGATQTSDQGANWHVNGTWVSDSFHLSYTPLNTGLDTITLYQENCTGIDSLVKYVYVHDIVRGPKANFTASSQDVYVGDDLQ